MKVYNPGDEPLKFGHAAVEYTLPTGESDWPEEVARHAASSCKSWGVVLLDSEERRQVADAAFASKNRAWCLETAKGYAKKVAEYAALGVKPSPSEDEAYALDWLKKHGA